jgi:CheY-like chemotaxis protein
MPKTILVVDDDPHLRRMMQTALAMEGYVVVMAGHGRQALHMMMKQPVDLIVMDIDMPEMDGLEALEKLKANPVTAPIPVIMLTAADRANDVIRSLDAGADLHLVKPFSPFALVNLVAEYFKE